MGTLLGLSIRQMAGRRRLIFIFLLSGLTIGLAVLVSFLTDSDGVHGELLDVLFDGMIISAALPIVTMALATASVGNELEDRTFNYIVLKPLARWQIALSKLLAPALIAGPIVIVTGVVVAVVLLERDVQASIAVGAALFAGVAAYSAVFTWAGAMTGSSSSALGIAVVYVFIWEGLLARLLGGIEYLSIRAYTLAIMHWTDKQSFDQFSDDVIELPAAIVGAAAVAVVFFALTVYRLRRMDVP